VPSEDEAVEMKRELESYFDRVGSAKEAVELYMEKHPEDKKHETLLLRIAMAVFDEVDDIEKTDLFEEDETHDEGENELPQEIINQIIPMYVEEGMEIEDIASMYPEMYNEVVEFLEGYDLGLDYDI
jgi:hypothetical protein